MIKTFANKTALVTGGSQGIGRTIVESLLKASVAKVHVLDKAKDDLVNLQKESNGRVVSHQVDLSKWNETKDLIDSIQDPIHCLVNNAGLVQLVDVGQVTEANVDLHLGLNVKTIINVTQCVSSNMLKNKVQGSIVNISSMASRFGLHGHLSYCMSKSAVNGITHVCAVELGEKGIRVNAVLPTITMTQLGREAWKDEIKARTIRDRIPLGKFAETSDIANSVLFLLSDQSSFLNGVLLPVDGGFGIR